MKMAQVAPMKGTASCREEIEDRLTVETDKVTTIELETNRRKIYFSDGTMEESSGSEDNDAPDRGIELNIDERNLPLMSRVKHKATKVGASVLAGIDFVGGGLASFFGITTPKYASELEYYKQAQAEIQAQRDEESNAMTWLARHQSGAEIVTLEHGRDINRNHLR